MRLGNVVLTVWPGRRGNGFMITGQWRSREGIPIEGAAEIKAWWAECHGEAGDYKHLWFAERKVIDGMPVAH